MLLVKSPCFYFFLFLFLLFESLPLYSQNTSFAKALKDSDALLESGNYEESLKSNRKIEQDFPKLEMLDQVKLIKQRAYLLTKIGQKDSSVQYLQEATQLLSKDSLNQLPLYASLMYDLAFSSISQNPGNPQIEIYLEESRKIRETHDPEMLGETQHLKANLFMKKGNFPGAIQIFESLIDRKEEISKHLLARTHNDYGISLIFMRRHPEAHASLETAMNKFEEHYGTDEHPDMINGLSYLGYISGVIGKLYSGRKYCEEALRLQQKFFPPDHPELAIIYYYLGGIYNNMQEAEKGLAAFQEAIRIDDIHSGPQMSPRKANFYMSLGAAYKGINDFDRSLEANQKAVDFFESLPNQHPFMDQLYANIGMTYFDKRDLENAQSYLDKSMKLALEKFPETHPSMVTRFTAYAKLYEEKKAYQKSLEYWEKAAQVEAVRSGPKSSRIAHFKSKQGAVYFNYLKNPQKALAFYEQAIAAMDLESWTQGNQYPLNQLSREQPTVMLGICHGYSLCLQAESEKQDHKKAFELILAAEKLVDSTRSEYLTESSKLELASNSRKLYELGIELAFELYQKSGDQMYLNNAFRLSEKSKALLLLLSLKHVQALQSSEIPESVLEKEQELERKIMSTKSLKSRYTRDQLAETDSISKILFALNASRDSLIAELELNYPQYFRIKYDPHIPQLSEIQNQLLQEKEAALVYFLDDAFVYRFDIRKDKVDFTRKELNEDFSSRIRDFRQLIYAPLSSKTDDDFVEMQGKFVTEAHRLYELLLPVKEDFSGIETLKIIPDGVLSMLSMDLLLSKMPTDIGKIRSYPWAIRDYEFSYLYSMGLWMYLEETRPIKRPEPRLLAFQPSYPNTEMEEGLFAERRAGFGPLKFSEAEVKGISDFYAGEILSGSQANEANFYEMAHEYPIIHISSHAMVPEKKQRDAFIALSHSENGEYDDSLMIEELYTQRLKAEMVVLSACETALGELAEGEGVLSLGRAFTYAGARSLIMSLWEVNDESTAEIMTSFYKHLAEGDQKSTALRKAKLAYIEKSDQLESQPYFWAAFLASGDMQPLPEKSSNSWLWFLAILGIIGIFWGIRSVVVR